MQSKTFFIYFQGDSDKEEPKDAEDGERCDEDGGGEENGSKKETSKSGGGDREAVREEDKEKVTEVQEKEAESGK